MHKINSYNFWLHQFYKDNMDIILNKAIPNNWDCVVIILGIEGAGKTTFASQSALYMDPNFNLRSTVFTPQDFGDTIDEAPEESSILWDEAITGANIKNYADEVNRSIISKMTQIRKKRLKFFMCFPYLYLLEKYFVSRAMYGVYVYAKDFDDRGYAYFYNQPQLEQMYTLMKSTYRNNPQQAIRYCNHAFKFHFDNKLCLPEKEYEDKKEQARINSEVSPVSPKSLIKELLRRGMDKEEVRQLVKRDDGKLYSKEYLRLLGKTVT